MRQLLLLLLLLPAYSEDYEKFKLKDGRELEGEYRNGSIVMMDGQVSVKVAPEDIVARAPKDRPAKKEHPIKPKPEPVTQPPAPTPVPEEPVAKLGPVVTVTQLEAMIAAMGAAADEMVDSGGPIKISLAEKYRRNFYNNWLKNADVSEWPGIKYSKDELNSKGERLTARGLDSPLDELRRNKNSSLLDGNRFGERGGYQGGYSAIQALVSNVDYPLFVKARGEVKASYEKE